MSEKFVVVENRNIGMCGMPEFMETVLYSGTQKECAKYEDMKRKEYRKQYGDDFGTFIDCFTEDVEERENRQSYNKALKEYAAGLTEDQRKEIVEIDGKRFYKYILDFKKQYGN